MWAQKTGQEDIYILYKLQNMLLILLKIDWYWYKMVYIRMRIIYIQQNYRKCQHSEKILINF